MLTSYPLKQMKNAHCKRDKFNNQYIYICIQTLVVDKRLDDHGKVNSNRMISKSVSLKVNVDQRFVDLILTN